MLQSTPTVRVYRHGHLFAGIGAGARGFNQAQPRVGNMVGRWECAGGIDVDPGAIRNFERLTGVPGTVMDLFSRDQYRAFHGRDPEAEWREAMPADIRRALGHLTCMLLSPPCKGFSGLLSQAKSLTDKYQALNALTLRGIWLTLEAYKDDPIRIILIENVPRIQTRGRWLLDQIIALLRAYGYSVNEDRHDCGEIGHLPQSRKRFLLIARHADLVPPFIYQPRKYRLRGVGEVIGQMPLPGDPVAGPMHRVPALQWQTWVRLAFVEAGSDWRSLNKLAVENGVLRDYGIRPELPLRDNAYGVCRWEDRSPLVTSARAPGQGRFSVADPRAFSSREGTGYLGVRDWIDHVGVVSSRGGPTNGGYSVADPRPGYRSGTHTSLLSVAPYDAAARVVSGAAHVAGGALSVADPKHGARGRGNEPADAAAIFSIADPTPSYGPATHRHVLGVIDWTSATGVVTGSPKPSTGAHSVADPRINGHPSSVQLGIRTWDQPAGVVTANMWVGSGPNAIADPRREPPRFASTYRVVPLLDPANPVEDPRAREGRHTNGKYRVTPYDAPANAVIGASTTGMGAFVVADPVYRADAMGQYANKMRVVPATAATPTITGSDRVGSGALSVADPRPRSLNRGDRQNYLSQSHYGIVGWDQPTGAIPGFAKNNNGSWSIADPREAEAEPFPTALPAKDDRLVARIVALDGTWHRPFTSAELLVIQGILDPTDYIDLIGTSDAEKREWVGNAIPPPASRGIAETVGETLLLADAGEQFALSPREIWVKPGALALTIDNRQQAFDLDGIDTWFM
ncbi:DNA cytosine methyltransferase [Sphingomonas sp. ABOLG]|jgi:site-specific DNA-cytosine methylase|uniref:DNA cytosine methyltransferase n=1 Tax=Sphingomonas sp. ABOLG TaxID=1985880 RepID=UPI000F7D5F5B|nr:DNA cytosine methyltransferase [Sphingomonas sp. ABOLG]RSV16137.1 DNA cytosine methyltransferase [Sphingomonas sp. ABOLG]